MRGRTLTPRWICLVLYSYRERSHRVHLAECFTCMIYYAPINTTLAKNMRCCFSIRYRSPRHQSRRFLVRSSPICIAFVTSANAHQPSLFPHQYASARLVYDPRLLRADAELRAFIKDRAANHPALTLQVPDAKILIFAATNVA